MEYDVPESAHEPRTKDAASLPTLKSATAHPNVAVGLLDEINWRYPNILPMKRPLDASAINNAAALVTRTCRFRCANTCSSLICESRRKEKMDGINRAQQQRDTAATATIRSHGFAPCHSAPPGVLSGVEARICRSVTSLCPVAFAGPWKRDRAAPQASSEAASRLELAPLRLA